MMKRTTDLLLDDVDMLIGPIGSASVTSFGVGCFPCPFSPIFGIPSLGSATVVYPSGNAIGSSRRYSGRVSCRWREEAT